MEDAKTLLEMLEEFLRRQKIDIAFLHEDTHPHLNTLNRYTVYINEGTTRSGQPYWQRKE
jgi:hypothetical protein